MYSPWQRDPAFPLTHATIGPNGKSDQALASGAGRNLPTTLQGMDKRIASFLYIVAGVGIGLVLPRLANNSENTDIQSPKHASKSARGTSRGDLATGTAARPGTKPVKTGGPRSANLHALLDLTSPHHSSTPDPEFYQKLQLLKSGDIAVMLDELGTGFYQDPRSYKVRMALINHWAKLDPNGAWAAAIETSATHFRSQATSAVITEVARTDPAKARALIDGMPTSNVKQAAVSSLVSVMAQDNPVEALRMLDDELGQLNRSSHLHSIFQNWSRLDPDAAIAKLSELKGSQERQQASGVIASTLAGSDPERAIQFANSLKNWGARRNALNNAIRVIAYQDPHRALIHLDDMPKGPNRTGVLSAIASSWMAQDSEGAMTWINSLTPAERGQTISSGIWQFVQSDAKKTAELLSSLPPSRNTTHWYSNLVNNWAQQDPKAAAEWVETLPTGSARSQAVSGLINVLATSNPEQAAKFIDTEGVHRDHTSQVAAIVANWAETDRSAALRWMNGLEVGAEIRQNIINRTISEWAGRDIESAKEQALSYGDKNERSGAIQALIGSWGSNDPQSARDWVRAELDGDDRRAAFCTLLQRLSYQDVESAVDMYNEVTAGLSAEDLKKSYHGIPSQIASSWAQHDASGAGEWVLTLPEGDARSVAVRQLVDSWGDADLEGAANFVLTLDNGKERDQAVERLVYDAKRTDPESAFDWAASIGDERTRERMIRDTATHWKNTDPDAARSAVEAADMSEKSKTSLLKSLQR